MGNAFLLPLRIAQLITASAVLILSSYGMSASPPLICASARARVRVFGTATLCLARVLVMAQP